MSIFKLILSNIRKRKGASITFFVMTMISALMMTASLSLIIGSRGFYEKKVESLNAPHFTSSISAQSYKDEFKAFAESYEGVTDVAELNMILTSTGTWHYKSGTATNSVCLFDESEIYSSFYKPEVIDKQNTKTSDMIILPIGFRSNVKAGQSIKLSTNKQSYTFTVYGFFEDTTTGASTMGANFVFIGGENFSELKDDANFTQNKSLFIRMEQPEMCSQFRRDYSRFAKLDTNDEFYTMFEDSKYTSMMFVTIISTLLILFSIIVLIIALIVAVFSISNSIYEDITTIGALKGLGYKNKKLKGSRVLEFVLIAALGGVVGSIIALLSFGFLGDIVASTSGLLWLSGVNFMPAIIAILSICLLVAAITFISVRKYKSITPISALRQSTSTGGKNRSTAPLEKYKMPLTLHLGIKRFFSTIKNNITLFVVVALLVFVSVLVNSISYNLNDDRSAMIQMVGLEMAEIYVQPMDLNDINEINDQIKSDTDNVEYTLLKGSKTAVIDDFDTFVETVENYDKLIIDTIVRGRYPKNHTEITLGAVTMQTIKKDIGDTITLDIDGITKSYKIVGITQNISYGGVGSSISYEAMLDHCPDFKMNTIYVYLNDGVNTDTYHNKLKDVYSNGILTADTSEQMATILDSIAAPMLSVSIVMIVVTIVIIAFVLFLMISAMIRKQKKEYGIMKAIGFTNKKLIMQTIISYLPSILFGTLMGVILGVLLTNPLISLFFSSAGLLKTYFIVPIFSTIAIGFGVFVASILMSYLISLRLKGISPQRLIAE